MLSAENMYQNISKSALIALVVGGLGSFMGHGIIVAVLPEIRDHFGTTNAVAFLLISAYGLVYVISQPFMGTASDKYGRKALLVFSLAFEGTFMTASGFADDMNTLIVLRGISAIGAGALIPAAVGLIGDLFSFERRGGIIGALQSVIIIGAAGAVPIGGFLGGSYGWRVCFIFVGVYCIIGAVIYAVVLPSKSVEMKSRKIDWKEIFRPVLLLVVLIMIASAFALSSIVFVLPTFLQDEVGYSEEQSSLAIIPVGIGAIISSPIAGRVSDKVGRRIPVIAGTFLLLSTYWLIPSFPQFTIFLFAILFIFGLGVGFTLTTLIAFATDEFKDAKGSAVGIVGSFTWVGLASGPAIFGVIIDNFNYTLIYQISTLIAIIPFALSFLIKGRLNTSK